VETVPREVLDARGIPALVHDLFTNGIIYGELAFPVDLLSPEDYPWLPFFSRVVTSLGLPGMDYGEVSSLLARTAGGFHASLYTGSPAPGTARALATPSGIFDLCGRDYLVYRFKALEEKTAPTLDLVLRLIREADFSDLRRIRDLALEMKNDMDASLAPGGHTYASCRSGRSFSRAAAVGEIWHGLEQLQFAHTRADREPAEISRTLLGLRDRIARGGLLINLTGSGKALDRAFLAAEERFCPFGPPRPRNPAAAEKAPFLALAGSGEAEVFASPSLQVGFASIALPAAPYAAPGHAAELALAHWLSTGPLWEDIRMRGGAYGAFAHPDGFEGIFSFSTYRDPNPQRSLGAFGAALGEAAARGIDEDALEKTLIGAYAREKRPKTPAEKGSNDFFRFLAGVEDYHREKKLRSLIALGAGELIGAAEGLARSTGGAPAVIIAGNSAGEKAARALGTEVRELPV
jgi:Zn-dependent M16 (insulinase) family peptidase